MPGSSGRSPVRLFSLRLPCAPVSPAGGMPLRLLQGSVTWITPEAAQRETAQVANHPASTQMPRTAARYDGRYVPRSNHGACGTTPTRRANARFNTPLDEFAYDISWTDHRIPSYIRPGANAIPLAALLAGGRTFYARAPQPPAALARTDRRMPSPL